MAILRKSAIALAAVFCLGIAVPAFAQGAGTDKSAADVRAAQATLSQIKALGAQIKARQSGAMAEAGSTPVARPVVRQSNAVAPETGAKRATGKKPAKKKKNP